MGIKAKLAGYLNNVFILRPVLFQVDGAGVSDQISVIWQNAHFVKMKITLKARGRR